MARRKVVVLVDDSADEAEFVCRALAGGYPDADLVAFRSGADALVYFLDGARSPRADMVLLDLKLPGLDGYTILRALRECFSGGELRW